LGITLRVGAPVTDLEKTMQHGHFDAAYLAIGAQLSHRARTCRPGRPRASSTR
jgi:hypothetical protein